MTSLYRIDDAASAVRRGQCLAAVLAAALALSGCGDSTKRALGLTKQAPDEFAVVSRAPLSQPPDYGLRPPRPGAPSPTRETPTDEARKALVGDAAAGSRTASAGAGLPAGAPQAAPRTAVTKTTPGESALLAKAGAGNADPGIRAVVNRESAVLAEADRNFIQRLLNYSSYSEDVVDAPAEARRLRENDALGRPATEGKTPTIERKERGLLEGIF
jgi:hypothetical protein